VCTGELSNASAAAGSSTAESSLSPRRQTDRTSNAAAAMGALTSTSLHSVQGSTTQYSTNAISNSSNSNDSDKSDVTVSGINTPPRRRGLLHGRKLSITGATVRKDVGATTVTTAAATTAAAAVAMLDGTAASDDSGDELSACVHVSYMINMLCFVMRLVL
jgi:hypothetical protein